jgi:hypothetical protein
MIHPDAPALGRDAGKAGQLLDGPQQRRPRRMGGDDQLAVEPAALVLATAVLDLGSAAFGHAPAVVPAHRRRSRQHRRVA